MLLSSDMVVPFPNEIRVFAAQSKPTVGRAPRQNPPPGLLGLAGTGREGRARGAAHGG